MSNVKHIETATFTESVLKAEKPVLVDFWAEWCGPCKSIAPILDEISNERSDVEVVKVDIDKNPEIAKKFGIRSIPTMILFVNGEVEATKVGAVSKGSLEVFLNSNI